MKTIASANLEVQNRTERFSLISVIFFFFFIFQGYVLVYDVTNFESFGTMDKLKKHIDKNKEKRDVSFAANLYISFEMQNMANIFLSLSYVFIVLFFNRL